MHGKARKTKELKTAHKTGETKREKQNLKFLQSWRAGRSVGWPAPVRGKEFRMRKKTGRGI